VTWRQGDREKERKDCVCERAREPERERERERVCERMLAIYLKKTLSRNIQFKEIKPSDHLSILQKFFFVTYQ
jgi:hypothetical protein